MCTELYFVAAYLDFLKPWNQANPNSMKAYLLFAASLSDRVGQLPSTEFA